MHSYINTKIIELYCKIIALPTLVSLLARTKVKCEISWHIATITINREILIFFLSTVQLIKNPIIAGIRAIKYTD